MSPDTATSSSSGFTASPLAAGARGIPRDGWNSWGHPQGHLAAKTRCTCQQSVSPKEWLYSLPCTEPVNEKPWVLKAPSHHGCTCQVKWGGVTNHSTLCFLSAFPSLWHAGGWVALPACLPACFPSASLPASLPGPAGRCSLARKAQTAVSPVLQLWRFLIPREEADFTARPWQTSLRFSEFVMDELSGTAGSTRPAPRGSEIEQLLVADGPNPPHGPSKADLTHFKQKCIKCHISTPNMGISRSG